MMAVVSLSAALIVVSVVSGVLAVALLLRLLMTEASRGLD